MYGTLGLIELFMLLEDYFTIYTMHFGNQFKDSKTIFFFFIESLMTSFFYLGSLEKLSVQEDGMLHFLRKAIWILQKFLAEFNAG